MTLDETFKAAKAGDLTNDTTYKVGEISRKTGLQKQPDGSWAPPKKTNYGKVTTNKNGEVGIQQTLGKGSKFEKFGSEKEAARALGNYTMGYNTTARSKEDPHSNEALLHKHWDKETEKIAKENKQNEMKNEVLEYLSHSMPKEKAEAFLDAAEPKTLRTMYNNLKYKIPGENKKLHEEEPAASSQEPKRTDNTTGKDYKEGQTVPQAAAMQKTMEHREKLAMQDYSKLKQEGASHDETYAAAQLVRSSRDLGELLRVIAKDPEDPINEGTAEKLNGMLKEHDRLQKEVDSIKSRRTVNPAASNEPDPILSEMDLHSIYMDIKNNELEDFSTEQIQKEYKITRGDAAAIKARIENNKRAREQDRRERSSQDAAYTAQSVNAPRENLERKLTGDCKIKIRK